MSLNVNSSNLLRAMVLHGYDGLVSNLGVVVGVVAAGGSRTSVVTASVVAAAAGAISMGTGEYLSVWTQDQSLEKEHINSRLSAALASSTFVVVGLTPLLAFLAGGIYASLVTGIAILALIGAIASRWTSATAAKIATRFVLFGGAAAVITWVIGSLFEVGI